MSGTVTLIIKAANQSTSDYHIDCTNEWSVRQLKDHLALQHPSKPRVEEQRLIYSGQLLIDNLSLRSVLRHPSENNSYTIHLVCSPPRNTPTPTSTPRTPRVQESTPTVAPTIAPTTTQPPTMATQPQEVPQNSESTDGVRRRNVGLGDAAVPTQQTIDATAYPAASQLVGNALQATGDPMQQMATMQQMYAHYMAYMQYMQMGGGMAGLAWPQQMVQIPTNPAPSTAATATPAPTPDQDLPRPQEPNAPQDPQQQQPQQIRMNAQGGEVDDDEEDEGMARDWLDWIYVLSRMVVLLSIVYFYSTLSRFMIVVCIAMLLYLYQAGWFRPVRRVDPPRDNIQDDRNNNVNNNNNNNDVPAGVRNEADEVGEDEEDGANNNEAEGDNGQSDQVVEEIPIRPSILALSWTFLTTFFTSLIPEQPQVL